MVPRVLGLERFMFLYDVICKDPIRRLNSEKFSRAHIGYLRMYARLRALERKGVIYVFVVCIEGQLNTAAQRFSGWWIAGLDAKCGKDGGFS